jgi:hypothetical protein
MKSNERHQLKENDFARTVAHARQTLDTRKRDLTVALVVLAVLVVGVGGFLLWRASRASAANEQLAAAMAVYEAPVVPLAAPAPGSPAPLPQAGTYSTEQEKLQARCRDSGKRRIGSGHDAGARGALSSRSDPRRARAVRGGGAALPGSYRPRRQHDLRAHGQAGAGGRAGCTGQVRQRDQHLHGIEPRSQLADPRGQRADAAGARLQPRRTGKEEAARAFDRIVQEFPQSVYVADARRELETARKS